MENSSLVSYVNRCSHHSGHRKNAVTRISPHCFVGKISAKRGCDYFHDTDREASANYVIGYDGGVGLSVDEDNRSWCTSSRDNDNRAITIECASDTEHPYAFPAATYDALVELSVDICRRYGKTRLVWIPDKDKALSYQPAPDEMLITVHRWFANKACPGQWLMDRMADYAAAVTAQLSGEKPAEKPQKPAGRTLWRVQVGAYRNKDNADRMRQRLQDDGYDTYPVQVNGLHKVQTGAFGVKANAERLAAELSGKGYDVYITDNGAEGGGSSADEAIKPVVRQGSRVKIRKGAPSYNGVSMAGWVYGKTYTVDELSGDRAVLDKSGLCTAFKVSDLIVV